MVPLRRINIVRLRIADDQSLRYRRDNRSIEEFHADIEKGSLIEAEIIRRYCDKTGASFEELGHDDGSELKQKSNAQADYLVNGEPVEVKFCRDLLKRPHIKKHHVEEYIKQGAKVLFVMGWESGEPVYSLIDPHDLIKYEVKVFWKKLTYRFNANDFEWCPL